MLHKYYEPTEYEQMLIAARWVSIEDLDPEYLEYLKSAPEGTTDYEGWQSMRREWDRLNERYTSDIDPLIREYKQLSSSEEALSSDLLCKMSELEYLLGY